jgi:hypothetical protein
VHGTRRSTRSPGRTPAASSSWDPFLHTPKEQATVRALRASTPDVDVTRMSKDEWRTRNEAAGIGQCRQLIISASATTCLRSIPTGCRERKPNVGVTPFSTILAATQRRLIPILTIIDPNRITIHFQSVVVGTYFVEMQMGGSRYGGD